MTAADPAAVADFEVQAREFLRKGRDYLVAGDLHQASEKGWGPAAHMAKAVAVAQGWEYETHADFSSVLNRATQMTGCAACAASPMTCTETTTVAAATSMGRSSARMISKAWRNCWNCSALWLTLRAKARVDRVLVGTISRSGLAQRLDLSIGRADAVAHAAPRKSP